MPDGIFTLPYHRYHFPEFGIVRGRSTDDVETTDDD